MLPKIGKKCNSKIRIIETQKYLEFLHGSIEEDACSEKKGKKIAAILKWIPKCQKMHYHKKIQQNQKYIVHKSFFKRGNFIS